MDTIAVYDQKLADLRELPKRLPITFQKIKEPDMNFEETPDMEEDESMILEEAKEILTESRLDYKNVTHRETTTDIENLNKQVLDENNYLNRRVPAQLNQIMLCIESLIHHHGWNVKDFSSYREIYKKAKETNGWERAELLSELRACLMWAIPKNKYYTETEIVDPMFGSASRTIEAT